MVIFDYSNNRIRFNGRSFPYKIIEDDSENICIISTVELESLLLEENWNYVSDVAQWVDEQITYFVETEKDLLRSSEDLLEEIYG